MQTIWYWQIAISLATLAGCAGLLYKNRVTLSKLFFMVGMTAVISLQLFIWPIEKRIDGLEREIALMEPDDPNRGARELALQNAKDLRDSIANETGRASDRLPVNLGMDFKGGTDIMLRLENDPARFNRLSHEVAEIEARLAEAQAAGQDTAALRTRLAERIAQRDEERDSLGADLRNAVDVIRRRLNNSGLAEIPVYSQGADRVLVQLPGMDQGQADNILQTIRKQGRLEFRMVVSDTSANGSLLRAVQAQNWTEDKLNIDPDTLETYPSEQVDDEGRSLDGKPLYDWLFTPAEAGGARTAHLVQKAVELRGDAVSSARAEPDPEAPGNYRVGISFTRNGAVAFERITAAHIGEQLAIVLDGGLQSAPVLRSRIAGGEAVITGNFGRQEAQQLDVVLKSGSLRAKITEEYNSSVGATLGEDSIRSGLTALVLGLGLTVLFMLGYYLCAGLVTDIVLIVNAILIVALLAIFNATVTLPGLAGLVLTVGMAVDANVLIFERIREERAKGNGLAKALHLGYSRAFVTIMDSNLTTLITALILHSFGTETVRGFAVTLIFGLLAGMFCSLVLTRWIFDALIEYKFISDLKMLQLFKRPNIDFIGKRKFCYGLSAVVCVAALVLVFWRGQRNLGQDFTGGILMQIRVDPPMSMTDARQAASAHLGDFPDARDSLQSYGQAVESGAGGDPLYRSFVLRTQRAELDAGVVEAQRELGVDIKSAADFRNAVQAAFPNLEPAGIESITPIPADRTPTGELAYEVKLSLRAPISPRRLAEHLVAQPNIMPLWIGTPEQSLADAPGGQATVAAKVKFYDADGRQRDEAALTGDLTALLVAPEASPFSGVAAESATAPRAPDNEGFVTLRGLATLKSPLSESAVRAALAAAGVADAATVAVIPDYDVAALSDAPASRMSLLVTAPARDALGRARSLEEGEGLVREQFQAIQRAKDDVDFTDPFPRFAVVGAAVASEMSANAFMALVFSLLAIFAYIWLRFQFRSSFGLGAVIALAHDVVFTLGALALVDQLGLMNGQIDLTVVAALLTVVGYSLNDTIVIYDRIREHMSETGRPVVELINRSLNETLSRTVITSGTTLLTVISMLVFGGEVIRGFAFTLFVGFMVGTYSSLFIAAPILIEFTKWKAERDRRKLEAARVRAGVNPAAAK